jgi:hypothetical protein
MSSTDDDKAPGWDAIDAAIASLYPQHEPRHVGYVPLTADEKTRMQETSTRQVLAELAASYPLLVTDPARA